MLRPLVVVSIPKAGTHLLTTLLGEWGYQWGGFLSAAGSARTGYWYMLAPPNAHTPASFVIAIEPYHPMTALPVLFIYRHPLDILVSQAYYYASDRTTAWASALEGWDLHERISRLISGTWLFRNLRDRIAGYLGWLDLGNVLPISFEELVGERGGGNKELQVSLIDSLCIGSDYLDTVLQLRPPFAWHKTDGLRGVT